jgi:hypothetical protein
MLLRLFSTSFRLKHIEVSSIRISNKPKATDELTRLLHLGVDQSSSGGNQQSQRVHWLVLEATQLKYVDLKMEWIGHRTKNHDVSFRQYTNILTGWAWNLMVALYYGRCIEAANSARNEDSYRLYRNHGHCRSGD